MTKLISVNECDVQDAHSNLDQIELYSTKRAKLDNERDPKTGKLTRPWHFEVVPGFFKQDDEETDDATFDFIDEHFGLKLESWKDVIEKVKELNANPKKNEEYKLIYFARHGQGFHNMGVELVGLKDWDNYWSKKCGMTLEDGTKFTWGPDPKLSPLGRKQVSAVHEAVEAEIKRGMPLPTKFFSSPFTRSASTLVITWKDLLICKDGDKEAESKLLGERMHPLVKEDLRETIGLHMCDKRAKKSDFLKVFKQWGFTVEDGFPEEDIYHKDEWREPLSEQSLRADNFLQFLYENYPNDSTVYTASHAGEIRAFITALGHRQFTIPTAGLIPIVVKGTRAEE